jgi:hypothetical protein
VGFLARKAADSGVGIVVLCEVRVRVEGSGLVRGGERGEEGPEDAFDAVESDVKVVGLAGR